MKYIVITIIAFSLAGELNAQNSKIDTLVRVTWSGTTWQNYLRNINTYDADCRLINALYQSWDASSSKWTNDSLASYSYITGKYTSEIVTQRWMNNAWTDNYKQSFTYNGSFKTISLKTELWLLNHWSNYALITYSYDNNGYADSVLVQLSSNDGPFENATLDITVNNSNGMPLQTINRKWNKTTTSWDNNAKYSFVYNAGKTVDTAITSLWNYNKATWEYQTKTVYTYTPNRKLFYYETLEWQTNKWVDETLYTYYYDSYGLVSNILVQKYDGFDFEKFTQTIFTNNSDGTLNQHTSQFWVEATNAWVNNQQQNYSYSQVCLLPLQLLDFTATKNNTTVVLDWKTLDEKDIAHFTMQRNTDGTGFSDIARIPAANSTGAHTYSYTDDIQNITAAKIYYRLKITGIDSALFYSKAIPVDITAQVNGGTFKVYPVPANNYLFVSFNMQNMHAAQLRITDVSGKIVYQSSISSNQANNLLTINISALSKGMYYAMLIMDNTIQRAKFVKQ